MILTKLDRRHHGYHYYTHFVAVTKSNKDSMWKLRRILEKDFGPAESYNQNPNGFGFWVRNKEWWWDPKRNRVYFNGADKASHAVLQL
jgi:hypothetical protein